MACSCKAASLLVFGQQGGPQGHVRLFLVQLWHQSLRQLLQRLRPQSCRLREPQRCLDLLGRQVVILGLLGLQTLQTLRAEDRTENLLSKVGRNSILVILGMIG